MRSRDGWRRACAAMMLGGLLAGPANASIDLTDGALYRTQGVPPWSATHGDFTIMVWVKASPDIEGTNDFFNADDGTITGVDVNVGTAWDSPTDAYLFTRSGEWHFNRDGTYTANPPQAFDVTADWTFLAVSFIHDATIDLYAWQAGVNGGQLVHVPSQDDFASVGGEGVTNVFHIGNRATFDEGCMCLLGPIYVYDGVALSREQIDAQRLQVEPLVRDGLIVFSRFNDPARLDKDDSGTADWSVHGVVRHDADNPPLVFADPPPADPDDPPSGTPPPAGTPAGLAPSSGGGGAMPLLALLVALAARRRLRR